MSSRNIIVSLTKEGVEVEGVILEEEAGVGPTGVKVVGLGS